MLQSADEKLRSFSTKPSTSRDLTVTHDPYNIEANTIDRSIRIVSASSQNDGSNSNAIETKMADRNLHRSHVGRSSGHQNRPEVKRRSRSAGPAGKMKARNSMDEKKFMAAQEKKKKASRHYNRKQNKARHSLYNEPSSDKEGFPDFLGSTSGSDSEENTQKKWVKNPLNVKKSKKNEKEKRKSSSYENDERVSNKNNEIRYRNVTDSPEIPQRDYYREVPDKNGNGQKGKYQRLEEMRKKRIDITVTSDEEINSPAFRISRLRQRALQGARNSVKLPETLDEWEINTKPRIPEKPRHLEIRQENPVSVENCSSGSEHITLRPLVPSVRNGMFRKIPKQESLFTNSQNISTDAHMGHKFGNSAQNVTEINSVHYKHAPGFHNSQYDKVINFHEVQSKEPLITKKAIDRVDKKRKSNSDDSLDDLIESNIQYLESEIESGKLKRISEMQPGFFPTESTKLHAKEKRRSASWEGVTKNNNNSFQNEVKLRLQIPSSNVNPQRSPSPKINQYNVQEITSQTTRQERHSSSSGSSSSLNIPCETKVISKSYVYQNTVPKVERKFQSATHSPYLNRKPTELYDMGDMSKSESQLSEHSFNYQRPSSYLHPQFYQCQGYRSQNVAGPKVKTETSQTETVLKSLSTPLMESGMFSDVDYDIEVSERVKKWEKLMKKRNEAGSSEDKGHVSLTTILEAEGGIPDNWKVEPETPVPIPQTISLTSASVTVTRSTPSVPIQNLSPRPRSPVTVKTYFEPKVQSSENSMHRIFRVVQDPRCCKAMAMPTESQIKWVQNPLSNDTKVNNTVERVEEQHIKEESVLRPNMTSKQGWPPTTIVEDSALKSSRFSKFEDELNELQDIKVESVSDLRRRFDSDASGNESTDVTETPATPIRMTPLRQRKQYAQVFTQPQVQPQFPEKKPRPPQPPLTVFQKRINEITIEPQRSKVIEADVWSPKLESKKGLVSIERVTARTLQTIPFSEDPIWREIEEMTNVDNLLAAEESDQSNKYDQINYNELDWVTTDSIHGQNQQHSKHQHQQPSYLKRNSRIEYQTPSTFHSKSTMEIMKADPKFDQYIKTRPFITPKIQPLKLSVTTKSSIDALDEVLEDIRHSLQKKSVSSETSSPLAMKETTQKNFFNEHFEKQNNEEKKNVISSTFTPYDPNYFRPAPDVIADIKPSAHKNVVGSSQGHSESVFIDPDYTQYPYIINGNYQLDPDLLKQKLLGTGLADTSGSESLLRMPPTPPERRHLHVVSQKSQTTAEEEVIKSMEELKKLAEDVEQKLRQIKTKIINTDENRLDNIVSALREFAPVVNPQLDQKVEKHVEQNTKKAKLQDALSELERIYNSLQLDDENVLTERREATLPRISSHVHSNSKDQKPAIKRTFSDSDYSSHYGLQNTMYSPPFHSPMKNEDPNDVEIETQKEFENINRSFETLLAEVSHPTISDADDSKSSKQDEHVAEINATLQTFLGDFRQNDSKLTESMNASDLADQFRNSRSKSKPTPAPRKDIALQNSNREVMKSEVFTATSGPFSVLVGINGNDRKARSKVRKTTKKVESSTAPRSQSDSRKGNSKQPPSKTSFNIGVGNSSSNDSGSKDESESESGKPSQVVRRPKKASLLQHRKSMPADMLKKSVSVETQTTDSNWVSPVAVIKEKFQERERSDREFSVSSENSDSQGPRKKRIAKGIALMMEFFSSSEDERSRKSKLSHSQSAPDLTELFSLDSKKSERTVSPVQNKPTTPRAVKQRYEKRKRSAELQAKISDEKTDEFSVASTTSDDGQKSSSKPPRHPGLRKQRSYSPEKTESETKDDGTENKPCQNTVSAYEPSKVTLRQKEITKSQDAPERPRSFHELLSTFESNKKRLDKLKNSLRKCASEDSLSEHTVFRKSYSSEPELSHIECGRRASDSEVKLNVEIKIKS